MHKKGGPTPYSGKFVFESKIFSKRVCLDHLDRTPFWICPCCEIHVEGPLPRFLMRQEQATMATGSGDMPTRQEQVAEMLMMQEGMRKC